MFKTLSIFFLLITATCSAQLFPVEGSMICFRLIGFSYPAQAGAIKYTVQVARGNYNAEAQFEKNIVTTFQSKTNRTIAEVPAFGAQYTWRITVLSAGNKTAKSPFYHFGTIITPNVDPALSRLRITTPAKKYKNAYVLLDGARVMYNMKGEPVWFLPGTEQKRNQEAYPRDLKLTPQGTLTFLTGGQPYEITYNGDIRWLYRGNKPNHSIDSFHHEFTRMHNGHYMAMRFENELFPFPAYSDKIARNAADSALFYHNIHCNAIAEYDEDNHIVWHWSGFDYIKNSDLFRHYANDSAFDIKDLHENSFYFDEKNKFVYISFRNINRIIKIRYPEGDVVNTYGPLYTPGTTKMTNDLFCYQHSIRQRRFIMLLQPEDNLFNIIDSKYPVFFHILLTFKNKGFALNQVS